MITPVGAPVYVSVRAGAGRAGVSTRTIKRWIVAGLLPAYRLPSPKGRGHLRIRLNDLEALLARGLQPMIGFAMVCQYFWPVLEYVTK
jgi:excisionase family DNA binding protein